MQLIKLSGTRKRSMKSALEFENIGEPEALWDHPKAVFFTICSWNYLGYAITLRESLIKTNGAIDFYAAICDDKDGFDGHSLSFPVILLDDLGIPSLEAMTKRYNITELNTAIKPFVFKYLFSKHPESIVIYMDPDIYITSRLEELRDAFLKGADCVLTPHILEPNEFATFDDQKMLQYGIYNLGFCALRATPRVSRVVSWWGRRLETQCVIDLANGLFVDQKWADLLPAFIEKTQLLHHCGYNAAYWNLPQRRIHKTEDGWKANDKDLRFFHFSGNRISDSALFSRHSQDFVLPSDDTSILFREYAEKVKSNGHFHYRTTPYAFEWNGENGSNLHTPDSERSLPKTAANYRPLGISNENYGILPHLAVLRAGSLAEYMRTHALMTDALAARKAFEVESIPIAENPFLLPGRCVVCGKPSTFQVSFMFSLSKLPDGRSMPNWREHLKCTHCGFISRLRAFLHIFFQEYMPERDNKIYISEQATMFYSWLSKRFPNLMGSEFMGADIKPGSIANKVRNEDGSTINGVRHEDLQNLSFEDDSFDYIFSLDVLEHIPDYRKAITETFRCLKRGGHFLFSVPFSIERQENHTMSIMEPGGGIKHLINPPEYHENPIDPENGSLCFRHFGWELLDDLRNAGFSSAECVLYWSRQYAYLGEPQLIIAADKPNK